MSDRLRVPETRGLFKPARVGGRLGQVESDADAHAHKALKSLPRTATNASLASNDAGTHLEPDIGRAYGEAFSHDFSHVLVHTGPQSTRAAAELGAPAYALGQDIVVGSQVAGFSPAATQSLLAHELAHVVQSSGRSPNAPLVAQRAPPASAPDKAAAKPATPAGLAPGRYKVILVGAPGKAEVDAGHPLQFAKAAAQSGRDAHTVWLVERTGYQLANLSESDVQAQAEAATVFWVDPGNGLVEALKSFPPHSIERMEAYGHGTPGLLAMRHGWPGQTDYGLSATQARSLSPDAFTPDATISFDSCNSASVADATAQATERPATGWTGRTSYHDVNVSTGGVKASEVLTEGGIDLTEAGSRMLGRTPERVTYAPSKSSGDFESFYSMTMRLPQSRSFLVSSGGSVSVKVSADSEYEVIRGGKVTVMLHRQKPWYTRDATIEPTNQVEIGATGTFSWSGLEQGTYYIELYQLSGMLVEGNLSVTIH